ncbi:MAG: hypothetical protein HWQ41_03485 [Nostoc sp. NOS(2021)]|uniref:hypothetical protein n=1 Tax=Nostoc sp. NOS(2021) TaxID=2815407 RepID=UPI0025F4BB34|nr:hypothetical protein [Nostoc sp. NOS(2021)]MBN3894353.1 hypothetical protein [Nostoc sp. NOS(2021)]
MVNPQRFSFTEGYDTFGVPDSLEETVKTLLQSLGKVNRPYLTAVEEKLLSVLESEYGREITP